MTNDSKDVSLNVSRTWIWAFGPYSDGLFLRHNQSDRGFSDGVVTLPLPTTCPGNHIYQNEE